MPDWQRQLALGLFMTQDVQRNAEQCLVHSQMARAILELDRDPYLLDDSELARFGDPARAFFNVNTPADLRAAAREVRSPHGE